MRLTMNLASMQLLFQLYFCISLLQYVNADRMMRFIFNNGVPPTSSVMCTAADFKLIDPLFDLTNLLNRNLRSRSNDNENDGVSHQEDNHRELSTNTARCKDNCLGYATGTCRSTGCAPRRKLGEKDHEQFDENTREALLGTCDESLGLVHDALDSLISLGRVTTGCRTYLDKSKRKAMCYDDVIYGEIESFNFWNMKKDNIVTGVFSFLGFTKPTTPTVTNVKSNGFTVCNNIPLNIEAVLNPCVDYVNFTITGPNRYKYSRFDYVNPMYLFDPLLFSLTDGGKYMDVGTYFIEAIPDMFAYKEKNLTFTVIRC